MAEYLIKDTTLSGIADAVRNKTGKTDTLSPEEMISDLNAIPEKTSSDLTVSEATVTVPAGNYKSQATKAIASPSASSNITLTSNDTRKVVVGKNDIEVGGKWIVTNSDGTIRLCTAIPTSGYYTASRDIIGIPVTTRGAATITPKTTNQTIAAETYLTGVQTIAGDADLVSGNIKKGVNIFGVNGSYEGVELNFEVVGGTTQPTNPKENTIWVNTSTEITRWYFSATQPENMAEGEVWLLIGDSSDVEFNVLKVNGIQIYPLEAKQMVSGALMDVEEKIYQNEEWKELLVIDYIIQDGNNIVDVHKSGTFREFTPNNNGNLLISTGSGYHHVYFNNIDLTNKDYIILEGEINSTSACRLCVCNNGGYSDVISFVRCTYSGATLDISALSGYYTVDL